VTGARIHSFGHAVPAPTGQGELWTGFFARHYRGNPVAERMFRAVGVQTRHVVVNHQLEDVSAWPTSRRMERYMAEALPLGKEAIGEALSGAGLVPDELGMLVVASCTGYASPGLNVLLARDLGMSPDLRSLLIGHMGCYASLPALAVAADYVSLHHRPALVLCLELTSLHLQPAELPTYALTPESVQQMVIHALFADAAAAVVVTPEGGSGGLEMVDVVSVTDTTAADMMTWDIGEQGFRMGLSPDVPKVLGRHARPAVESLLGRHGLSPADVGAWAIHPGGPAILESVRDALGLPDQALDPSREVLRDYGNCSSPTVLLILERVAATLTSGDYAVALAFGPGLTLYGTLLRMR
jgi:predicted naringenin-chalcone synthase